MFSAGGGKPDINSVSMIASETHVTGSHDTVPYASGSAPSATEVLTKIETQSLVAHEPFGTGPVI
jgi:hypothetical protein